MMATVILHLGSNKGNRNDHLLEAYDLIEVKIGKIISKSDIYETSAWGVMYQDPFLNSALKLESKLTPFMILSQIQDIELQIGRIRANRWGPREIDIDIVFYDELVLQNTLLTIPHPYFDQRKFVLKPLFDIIPNYKDPIHHKSMIYHLGECKDELSVKIKSV